MDNRDLFTVLQAPAERPTIGQRFESFDDRNPEVYRLFVRFAREARAAGHDRYSADAILHRIRWHLTVETSGDESGFRLNNSFTSRYARKMIADYPEFGGFFELRVLKAE